MRRLVLILLPLIALLGFAGTAEAATAKTYTLTRTAGPFNGAAKIGENGSVPDGEALVINCKYGDTAVKGSATIKRTTSHGTTSKDVLRIGRHGVNLDPDTGSQFYAFVDATGKKGWNSVKLSVTCRDN